jgi:adenosylhomocysteine nucleosidase
MRPLLMFAMEQEAQSEFAGYDMVHSHIGKVNAAHALTRRLCVGERPSIVVNLGTAGSRKHMGGSIVNPTRFVQRDMDVRPLGFDLYKTPLSSDPIEVEHGVRIEALAGGVCGTGDNFDVSDQAAAFDVVDMEAYALALICQRERVDFLCLKYISDGADGDAEDDFAAGLKRSAQALKEALKGAGY